MARERPTASDEQSNFASLGTDALYARAPIRPEATIAARSAPLAPAEFKALGRLVDQGTVPLHAVLARLR